MSSPSLISTHSVYRLDVVARAPTAYTYVFGVVACLVVESFPRTHVLRLHASLVY
jgi:hypothetical protein